MNSTPEDLVVDESGNGSQLDSLKLVERMSAMEAGSSTPAAAVEPNWKT